MPPTQLNLDLRPIVQYLSLLLVALTALTDISDQKIRSAVAQLDISPILVEQLIDWRKSRSHLPNLEADEDNLIALRSQIKIICYLASQNQEQIRRTVVLLEQLQQQSQPLSSISTLKRYVNRFIGLYWAWHGTTTYSQTQLVPLANKLLVDLLFCSSDNGSNLIWQAWSK